MNFASGAGERELGPSTYEHSVDTAPDESENRATADDVVRVVTLDESRISHPLRSFLFSLIMIVQAASIET